MDWPPVSIKVRWFFLFLVSWPVGSMVYFFTVYRGFIKRRRTGGAPEPRVVSAHEAMNSYWKAPSATMLSPFSNHASRLRREPDNIGCFIHRQSTEHSRPWEVMQFFIDQRDQLFLRGGVPVRPGLQQLRPQF